VISFKNEGRNNSIQPHSSCALQGHATILFLQFRSQETQQNVKNPSLFFVFAKNNTATMQILPLEKKRSDDDDEQWVNNLNKTAIENVKTMMERDESMGLDTPVCVEAVWENGTVTGVNGKLVCYPPKAIQLGSTTKGPSVDSYCPLIAGGCFCMIMLFDAAEKGYQFEQLTSQVTASADFLGFYKPDWTGTKTKSGYPVQHPWGSGIKLGIVIHSDKSQDDLSELADHANRHCPSSEIMKRSFPVGKF
jgi:organic hydroperoxide reductase OsmC/OhrA